VRSRVGPALAVCRGVQCDLLRRPPVRRGRSATTETKVGSNADKLTTAVVPLLAQIRADQADLTTYVLAKQ